MPYVRTSATRRLAVRFICIFYAFQAIFLTNQHFILRIRLSIHSILNNPVVILFI